MRSLLRTSSVRAIMKGIACVSIPVWIAPPMGAQILPREPINTSPTIYAGVAPTGFRVASATPASVAFSWASTANATGYTILRSTGAGQPWTTVTPTPLPATALTFSDQTGVDYRVAYIYRLQANYSSTPPGYVDLPVTLPAPVNPSGFTAKQTGEGTAELSWTAVPNASYYWIWGPGTGTEGVRADGTRKTFSGIGTGPKEWSITTRYDPAGVLLASSTWPKAQLNMVSVSGRYRITLNGFQVVSPTKEVITFDGAGNEVFAIAYARTFDRTTGAVLNEGSIESAVHGDTEGFAGRVRAGSAKATGGLLQGDRFPTMTPWQGANSASTVTFPLLVWEGPLTDGKEVVVVTPTIWEWQGSISGPDRTKVNAVNNEMKANSSSEWQAVSAALSGAAQTWNGPTQIPLPGLRGIAMAGSYAQAGVDLIWVEENLIHAIGADTQFSAGDKERKQYSIRNMGIVFTRELIEKALSSTTQVGALGPGVIEVKWNEKYPGATGNYTLYVQVARQ